MASSLNGACGKQGDIDGRVSGSERVKLHRDGAGNSIAGLGVVVVVIERSRLEVVSERRLGIG